jgi:hypothetical protein
VSTHRSRPGIHRRLHPSAQQLLALSLVLAGPSFAESLFVGEPFRVNTTTRDSQVSPAVAASPAGASVVVWACQGVSSWEICAQRFNAAGRAVGGELAVNVHTSGIQQFPAVAVGGDGRFVVAWESAGQDGDDWGIYLRRFAANGMPLGGEVRVNVETKGRQRYPAVAMLAGGGSVVAWESNQVPSRFEDVYVRRFDAKGQPLGGEVRVNTTDRGLDLDAAVTGLPGGGFVVAWRGSQHIYTRRFGAGGGPAGGETQVSQYQGQLKKEPAIAADADGGYVVVWQSSLQDGSNYGVYARRFAAGGRALGGEQRVNQTVTGDQIEPALAVSPEGDFAVVWHSWQQVSLSTHSIVGRTFDANGIARGGEIVLAVDDDGDLLFVWQGPGPDIDARRMLFEAGECHQTATAICLGGERYKLESAWRSGDGEEGAGRVEDITADTGYLWFFDRRNVEAVFKVLDGCPVNGHGWLFAAGLTDLAVDLTVTDTLTGQQRSYHSPAGEPFAPVRDTGAFSGCGVGSRASIPDPDRARLLAGTPSADDGGGSPIASPAAPGLATGKACNSSTSRLCLNGQRFAVEVDWRLGDGQQGRGTPRRLTSDTGLFWFFDRTNLEVVAKVLDACGVNGHYWVFAAGLTDVGVELRVIDTASGKSRRYASAVGRGFAPVQDLAAFSCQ